MANITIKNIPDEVYEKLKDRAKRNRRSINNEVIHLIESQFRANQVNAEEIRYEAEKFRQKIKRSLTTEEIEAAINEGRE
ncbi:MAG: Arc family DNA-binding protein [Balneolaceae bacterium]|nr:Arc family DNA-binding protein [Balneolaceae bacterium]